MIQKISEKFNNQVNIAASGPNGYNPVKYLFAYAFERAKNDVKTDTDVMNVKKLTVQSK